MKKSLSLLLVFSVFVCTVQSQSIAQVRALYSDTDITLPMGTIITGVVISDTTYHNTIAHVLAMQDSTAGLSIYFSNSHPFANGDKITIDLSGCELTLYNGLYQIQTVALNKATKVGTGVITPRTATIAQIISNSILWQSTLLQIPCAMITEVGTALGIYSSLLYLHDDATDSIRLFTRSPANFANDFYPTDTVNLVGYLTFFTHPEFRIRNITDVHVGCIPFTPVATAIEEVLVQPTINAEDRYYDLLGREISRDQCSICFAVAGNKARKIAVIK